MMKVFQQKNLDFYIDGVLVDIDFFSEEFNLCRHTIKFVKKEDISTDNINVDVTYFFDSSIKIKESEMPKEI